jgi:hypothetical protein
MEQEDNLKARSSGALSKYYWPDLIRRLGGGTVFERSVVSNRPLTAELAHSDSFERYDIALPVNATEYVQTRMALTLQLEVK